MSSPKVEVVVKGCHSALGEGPHWDTPTQSLYTVDIYDKRVHRWDSRTGKESKIDLDGNVTFVIPREKGGLVIGLSNTVSSLDFDSKSTQVLVEVDVGTTNRCNDGKCDRAGRLWAGTMGVESTPGIVAREAGSLYCIDTDLKVSKQDSGMSISNGMGWSEDNTVMYFNDSLANCVYAYDFDYHAGNVSNRRTVLDLGTCGLDGFPDGMCVDCEDKIWVALFSASKVARFDPETGKVLSIIDFPATNITSCSFGGPQLDELFVTSSSWKLPEGSDQPFAGSLFRVTGLGVKGRAPNNFCG